MGETVYSKTFEVKRKIITEDDILRIARFIHKQSEPDVYEEEYMLNFDDRSQITGKRDIDVFFCDEFKHRRTESVKMRYRSSHYNNKIDVDLRNSLLHSGFNDSEIEIISNDKAWFNSVCNQMKTIIDEIEPQKLCLTFNRKMLFAIVLGIIEAYLLAFAFKENLKEWSGTFSVSAYTVMFSSLNMWLLDGISKAYPEVEFSFGPAYLNKSKKIRRAIGILIPFAIDLILFFLGR